MCWRENGLQTNSAVQSSRDIKKGNREIKLKKRGKGIKQGRKSERGGEGQMDAETNAERERNNQKKTEQE